MTEADGELHFLVNRREIEISSTINGHSTIKIIALTIIQGLKHEYSSFQYRTRLRI